MRRAEFKDGPSLLGWVGAAMMALVAFVAAVVVGGFDLTPAGLIAGVIFVVVGLILGLPRAALPGPGEVTIKTPVIGAQTSAAQTSAAKTAAIVVSAPSVAEPALIAQPAAMVAAAAPASAFVAMVPEAAPTEPLRLASARGGVADNLKEIEGIGPAMEKLCNGLGFYHFDQVANWTEADVAWVDENMAGFRGRIARDKWVVQAKLIVAEGLDAFRIRAKTNDY